MPQGKDFWNPYRWVTIGAHPVKHDVPNYHHTLSGISGRIWCRLKALTPLIIGDGGGGQDQDQVKNIEFVRKKNKPYIPSTSLKGVVRSLAEVVGNATVPFPKAQVDHSHKLEKARKNISGIAQFDPVARTFGYLKDGDVVAGLIHFSDAEVSMEVTPPDRWEWHRRVAVGRPQPNHKAFYPGTNRRKFYHHHPGVTELREAPANITQVNNVRPAPPKTCFEFTVDFTNLRDAELNLLLYCLVLEEQVTVELSPAALGREQGEPPCTFEGPLRHKMGGAKPHGAGSVRIQITKMELRTHAAARYRGGSTTEALQADALAAEIDSRTASFQHRTDLTMRELRAMLIYSTNDPRKSIRYPRFDWFQNERELPFAQQTRLKPTI